MFVNYVIRSGEKRWEFRRIEPTFVGTLRTLNIFIRSTNLETVDTVEIGMFLGLHPLLTNIKWRYHQITDALGFTDAVPLFQIYRRKLTEKDVSTSTIVLRCAEQDAQILQERLLALPQNAMGDQVEFIPYSVLKNMTTQEITKIFQLQNETIAKNGAIAIQGIPKEIMKADI